MWALFQEGMCCWWCERKWAEQGSLPPELLRHTLRAHGWHALINATYATNDSSGSRGKYEQWWLFSIRTTKKKNNKLVYLCFWSSFISLIPCGLEPKITGKQNKQPQVKTVVILFDADWSDYTILLMQTGFWSVPVLPITIPLWFCVTRRISGPWKPSVASCRNLLIVLVLLCSIALSYKLPVC